MLGNLFKSTAEREREARMKIRQAEREAERGIERIEEQSRQIERLQADAWRHAGESLKMGKRAEAGRFLQQYEQHGMRLSRLDKHVHYLRTQLLDFLMAGNLMQVVDSIKEAAVALKIDPVKLEGTLEELSAVGENVEEMNKTLSREQEREARRTEATAAREGVAAVNPELMRALEQEVAAEVGGAGGLTLAQETTIDAGLNELSAQVDKLEGKA